MVFPPEKREKYLQKIESNNNKGNQRGRSPQNNKKKKKNRTKHMTKRFKELL